MDEMMPLCARVHVHTVHKFKSTWCVHACAAVCFCTAMVFDGRFYCFEPLKAPRFPLGEFSCRQLISDQHVGGWKTNCTLPFKLFLMLMQK